MNSDNITSHDYAWCILMFVLMTLIRAVMMVLFYPFLSRLGYGTTPKESAFMVWAGLRG